MGIFSGIDWVHVRSPVAEDHILKYRDGNFVSNAHWTDFRDQLAHFHQGLGRDGLRTFQPGDWLATLHSIGEKIGEEGGGQDSFDNISPGDHERAVVEVYNLWRWCQKVEVAANRAAQIRFEWADWDEIERLERDAIWWAVGNHVYNVMDFDEDDMAGQD